MLRVIKMDLEILYNLIEVKNKCLLVILEYFSDRVWNVFQIIFKLSIINFKKVILR